MFGFRKISWNDPSIISSVSKRSYVRIDNTILTLPPPADNDNDNRRIVLTSLTWPRENEAQFRLHCEIVRRNGRNRIRRRMRKERRSTIQPGPFIVVRAIEASERARQRILLILYRFSWNRARFVVWTHPPFSRPSHSHSLFPLATRFLPRRG